MMRWAMARESPEPPSGSGGSVLRQAAQQAGDEEQPPQLVRRMLEPEQDGADEQAADAIDEQGAEREAGPARVPWLGIAAVSAGAVAGSLLRWGAGLWLNARWADADAWLGAIVSDKLYSIPVLNGDLSD